MFSGHAFTGKDRAGGLFAVGWACLLRPLRDPLLALRTIALSGTPSALRQIRLV